MFFYKPPVILLVMLSLSACSPLFVRTPPSMAGNDLSHGWKMEGRMVIDDGRESWHVRVVWRQLREHYELDFSTALGRKLARIAGNQNTASMTVPGRGGPVEYRGRPDALMRQYIGWVLPLDSFRYWVAGHVSPDGSADDIRRDAGGRLQGFEQQAWAVSYPRYFEDMQPAMPRKMRLVHPQLKVKLVVDRWSPA